MWDALARIKSLEEERSFRKNLDATCAHIKLLEAREKEQCHFYELKVQQSEVALALSDKCLRKFKWKAMATEVARIRQRREAQSESVVEGAIFPLRKKLAEVEHNYLMQGQQLEVVRLQLEQCLQRAGHESQVS